MRRIKITADSIQRDRMENYISHFETRNLVKAMEVEVQEQLVRISRHLPKPVLNAYGCDSYTDQENYDICQLGNAEGLKADILNPWYISEEGWADFQSQWQQLPEPTPQLIQELETQRKMTMESLMKEEDLSTGSVPAKSTTWQLYPETDQKAPRKKSVHRKSEVVLSGKDKSGDKNFP